VATLLEADVLILLSDVDALYTKPPQNAGAERIEFVTHADDFAGVEIGGNGSLLGTGGAETKILAARFATGHGVPVILTSAENVGAALSGDDIGTWFEAAPRS
jgi:glutamate 5-kinase